MENIKHIITVDADVDTDMLNAMESSIVFDDMSCRSGDISYDDIPSSEVICEDELTEIQPFQEVSDEQLLCMIRDS